MVIVEDVVVSVVVVVVIVVVVLVEVEVETIVDVVVIGTSRVACATHESPIKFKIVTVLLSELKLIVNVIIKYVISKE